MKIILASTSPYRQQQLKDFGLRFLARAPLVDEEKLKSGRRSPRALSRYLAQKKAESLLATEPHAVIIGADQLVSFQGQVLGKPKTAKNARAMLTKMQGRSHQLHTSLCVLFAGRSFLATVTANITLRKLTKREIVDYVERDQPLDCAGSYKFERSGLSLVQKLRVSDPSSLTGLSMLEVMRLLLKISSQSGEPIPFHKKAAR